MRNDPVGLGISNTFPDGLNDIKVVEHVVHRAVVWQAIEESPNSLFGSHECGIPEDDRQYIVDSWIQLTAA